MSGIYGYPTDPTLSTGTVGTSGGNTGTSVTENATSVASLNNALRGMAGDIGSWRNDISGQVTTTGSGTAYLATTNSALTTLATGTLIVLNPHADCGTDPTLNVDTRGAKQIQTKDGTNAVPGEILAGRAMILIYRADFNSAAGAWVLLNPASFSSDDIGNDSTANGGEGTVTEALDALNSAKANLASPVFTGNPTAPTQSAGDNSTKIATTAFVQTAVGDVAMDGFFYKANHEAVAFTKTGNGTAEIKAGTKVEVNGSIVEFATATAITMPSLTAGTDYAVWVTPAGGIQATTDFTTPPVANARKIGGFHYAPGGNATAFNAGGNTTPQINEYSFWDLKWRPACPDPRGMTLVAGGFWCDIYLLGVNHHTDGTSVYNVTIADGSTPPKVPTAFGGNGSTDYGSFTSFEAREVMASHGKHLLSYDEFMAAAYGTDEETSAGTDPVSTILRSTYTSIWGVMLASGNLWIWGREFGGPDNGASWNTSTEGRGSVYNQPNAALFGGSWNNAANAGSRASNWSSAPWNPSATVGARGRSDHLCLL